MSQQQMDPGENEYEQVQDEREDEETRSFDRNEQSARTFFAFLSFFVAIILLGAFITVPLDGLSKLVVLFASVGFGFLGVYLLDKRLSANDISPFSDDQDEPDEPADTEEAEDEDEGEDEDDEETRRQQAFMQLVQEALESIPPEFQEQMENLVVIVEDQPDAETLEHAGSEEGSILLGLYQGVPLTQQGYQRSMLPERITIYQNTIERYCQGDPDRIREQVRATVLHEVAHHFGMGHEEMPIWVK